MAHQFAASGMIKSPKNVLDILDRDLLGVWEAVRDKVGNRIHSFIVDTAQVRIELLAASRQHTAGDCACLLYRGQNVFGK